MRVMRGIFGVWLLLTAGVMFAEAGARRFGVFVGSNDGGRERGNLRWAESDAQSMSGIFGEVGGIRREDNAILTRPDIRAIRGHLKRVSEEAARAKNGGRRTEVVFYFSGHSNEEGLLLGRESYGYKALREDINAVPADMRIVILDSCASGAFTRVKGGVRAQAFLLDEQAEATGYAFLTSSSATEVSQESDRIRGSYFTRSLIAGLRGAADTIGNGRVTLNEAYRYAYDETLEKTERTLFGRQHPSYDIQLSGSGDVVLTDVRSTSAGLILGGTIAGRLSIRDKDNFLIAEITKTAGKTLELALEPGRYRLTLMSSGGETGDAGAAGKTIVSGAEVTLEEERRLTVNAGDFSPLDLAEAVARGDVDAADVLEETADAGEAAEVSADAGGLSAGAGDESAKPGDETANRAAGEAEPAQAVDLEPIKMQLFPGPGSGRRNTTVNLLFGLFAAESYQLEGLGVALIGLSTRGDMKGMQISGLVNFQGGSSEGAPFPGFLHPTGARMRGAQFAGIGNWAGSVEEGAQFAGVYNWVGNSIHGAQFSGIVSWAGKDIDGAQFAGIVNWAGGAVRGAQIAGVANWTGGAMAGTQFAGLINYAGGGMAGGQYAGIVNVAWGMTRGLQAGIFNIRDKGSGGQIGLVNIAFDERVNAVGLVNIVKNGLFHPLIFTDNLARYNIGLKSGNKWLYSLVRIGVDGFGGFEGFDSVFHDGFTLIGDGRVVNTLGIGVELAYKKVFFDIDISAGHIPVDRGNGWFGLSSFLIQARLGAGFKLFSHLGFSGGLTYTYFFRDDREIGFYAGVQL